MTHIIYQDIVEELAGFGAKVHTCSKMEIALDEIIQEQEGKGFQVSGSTCDLASKTKREELMKTVAAVFDGKLNILSVTKHIKLL